MMTRGTRLWGRFATRVPAERVGPRGGAPPAPGSGRPAPRRAPRVPALVVRALVVVLVRERAALVRPPAGLGRGCPYGYAV